MDDAAVLAQGVKGRRPAAVPGEIGVAVVLEDRHCVAFRQPQQVEAALFRHDGAGRVLHGRNGVDVFGVDAAAREILERRLHRIDAHALTVERDAYRLDPEPRQPVQRALVAVPLDEHSVARGEQESVDQIEPL